MKKENLYNELLESTNRLLALARQSCWNNISDKCDYILTEIEYDDHNIGSLSPTRNQSKKPRSLRIVSEELISMFHKLYDVNLFIYKSTKDKTIVEVRYFLRSKLHAEFNNEHIKQKLMIHAKIAIPPYHLDKEKKFDINWKLRGLRYQLNYIKGYTYFKLKNLTR